MSMKLNEAWSERSAPASAPAPAPLPLRAGRSLRGMCAIKTRAGDVPQHPLEAAATPEILLVLLRARTSLPVAALLRVGDGRNGDDPCRERGENQLPHHRYPKAFRHALY